MKNYRLAIDDQPTCESCGHAHPGLIPGDQPYCFNTPRIHQIHLNNTCDHHLPKRKTPSDVQST